MKVPRAEGGLPPGPLELGQEQENRDGPKAAWSTGPLHHCPC